MARDGRSTRDAVPLRHPAFLVTAIVAAGCLIATLANRIEDPDVWQHLAVGRAIWTLGRVPLEHLWTWPSYGQPDVLPSWGYRALLWPFWAAGEVHGIFVLRWLLALSAFGLAWAAARRLGARGLTALAVVVACVPAYRGRSQLRPEMLVAVLLALQIWLLERRRARGSGGAVALIAVACVWANVHLSYFLGLGLLAIHALFPVFSVVREARSKLPRREPRPQPTQAVGRSEGLRGRAPLLGILAAGVLVSFLNPFGWRALWQPMEYFTTWRHESIYATVAELEPFIAVWRQRLRTGLPLLIVLWPVLVLWRPRGRRLDPIEALTCAMFTTLTLFAQRFAGLWAVAAAPYLARDVAIWLGTWRWPGRVRAPRMRAAIVSAACVLACLPSWTHRNYSFGIAFDWKHYPVGACDAIERAGIRGRAFNPYYFGGYLLWRFWPQRDRLPFMDIHQSGTPDDRRLAGYVLGEPRAWIDLDRRHQFEVAVIDGHLDWIQNYRLPDALDADPSWALVFRDDAAEVWLRRRPPFTGLADSLAYHVVPGGDAAWRSLARPMGSDSALRAAARAELQRMRGESPHNAWAETQLATLAYIEGDRDRARAHLEAALRVDPRLPAIHRRLGYLELEAGRPKEAIRAFREELSLGGAPFDIYTQLGQAHEALGELGPARRAYQRALRAHPNDAAARAGLARLESR